MRRTVPAVALLALALTGCDDPQEEVANTPQISPTTVLTPPPPPVTTTPSPEPVPSDPQPGSEAPAPDPPGPGPVPTPSEQLADG